MQLPPSRRMEKNLPATDQGDIREALERIIKGRVSTAIFNIPEELRSLSEEELVERFPNKKPKPMDSALRTAFWIEYASAVAGNRNMNMTSVWNGVCSLNHFYDRVIADKERLAYITLPPKSVDLAMKEMLTTALEDYRKAWDVAFAEFKTTKDPKMFESMRKGLEMMILHTQGAPIHRVEQKNLNVNMTGKEAKDAGVTSMDDIDKQLKELETSLGGDVIEVTGKRLENANDD